MPPASFSEAELQLSAQHKANLGTQPEQGSLRQAAVVSSQVQLPNTSCQPLSCHNHDASIATDAEQVSLGQNQGAAAAASGRQKASLQSPPASRMLVQQADVHPSAGPKHAQHAQQEQAAEGPEAQHAQQECAFTVASDQLVGLPDAQQTNRDHEKQKQDAVQQPVASSVVIAQDNQQLPDAAIATIGQPNQQLNAKLVVQWQPAQPGSSQQLPEAQQPPEAQQAQQQPEAQQAQQPPEAQQAQHASNAAAQAECNGGLDNMWQADLLHSDADTLMLDIGRAQQNDVSGCFETQHAQHDSHTKASEAQHAQQAPDSIMAEAQIDSTVHEAQLAQESAVSSDGERSNLQSRPVDVPGPQSSNLQVGGHAEVGTDRSAKTGLQLA